MAHPGDEAEVRLCNQCRRRAAQGGRALCDHCLATRASQRRRLDTSRRAKNLCPNDGNPVEPGKTRCRRCSERGARKERERYAERSKAGRCPRCGRDPGTADPRFNRGPDCRQCPACFFSDNSRSHFGVRTFGKVLMEMFLLQGGRCALTGVGLVLGENTSLDHRVPRSRGGPNTVANVQWCSRDANQSKGRLTNEEYLEQCRRVIDWCASPEYARVQRRLKRRTKRQDDNK